MRPPSSDAEAQAFADIFVQSLMGEPPPQEDWFERWLEVTGRENLRLVLSGRTVAGGLALLRMGQWFGGRSVPMTGVSAVVIAPEHRGQGAANALMTSALEEIRRERTPLSGLYPAAQRLYRKFGYELAGTRHSYRLPIAAFSLDERKLPLRSFEPSDALAVREAYRERARRTSGNLDRSDWVWWRILERPARVHAYVVGEADAVDGYVVFVERPLPTLRYELVVLDLVANTRAAAGRLLTFFGDHRSMATGVVFFGAPADPLLQLLPEQQWTVEHRFDWMLRIMDVRGALEARGYPPGLEAELHLAIEDGQLETNRGRYVVEIGGGEARVSKGGSGRVRLGVRGLASLYTGWLSASDLARTGALSGRDADLGAVSAAFAGVMPWMPDMY